MQNPYQNPITFKEVFKHAYEPYLPAGDRVHANPIEELSRQLHANATQKEQRLGAKLACDRVHHGVLVGPARVHARPRDVRADALVFPFVERDHRFEHCEHVAVAVIRSHIVDKHDEEMRVVAGVEARLGIRVEERDDEVALAQGHRQDEVDLGAFGDVRHRDDLDGAERAHLVDAPPALHWANNFNFAQIS